MAGKNKKLHTAFGKVLKEQRKIVDISQNKLAEACELDRTYISLLERGLRQPSLTTIFSLAQELNTSPSKVLLSVEKKLK